ncbi:Tubulin-tyrosine ligase family protein [Tritrichomonas foetus]|uniref:Tubulin-tyrosine ligase family protein n=1 Tax=Tritrichomonas foetus TaxID=1144522 RepID=A0A1J4JGX3_9EUKA|nr:Tubulin-tyrosine ligase family protein [Tritrichomonas foetus]|eukprot:OHS96725.1 Tubulin-tyrosine ligase family protein [Tritrichomonas foetus]
MSAKAASKPKKKKGPKTIFFNVENTQYPSIPRCGKRLGWKTTESTVKNILFWCDNNVGVEFCLNMQPWQFVNHFPGTFSISRKVELARNIEKMQKLFPKLYNFHPLSFTLPMQALDLKQYMQTCPQSKRTFIIKPDLGAQGKGIFLVMDPEVVDEYTESAIAQRYISPCLLEGLKFDFRIYALMSSIDPLRVYIFTEGMTRFCTEPYVKPKPSNLKDVYRHLTNYSVNKKNENFQKPDKASNPDSGHKRSLTSVFHELELNGFDVKYAQSQIDQLIVLTILSAQRYIAHNYRTSFKTNDGKSRCFEILGFDVMLGKNLKPWLLEVNHSPSLLCESPFDKELKDNLITGALKIMDFDPSFKKKVTNHQRQMTLQRMYGEIPSGNSNNKKNENTPKTLFDPNKESEIAKTTGWRQIYPIPENPELMAIYDEVMEAGKTMPIDGSNETAASRHRREAIQSHIKEKEKDATSSELDSNKPSQVKRVAKVSSAAKPGQPSIISKTPRSQLLLREAKLQKLRSDSKREQFNRFQLDTFPSNDSEQHQLSSQSSQQSLPPFNGPPAQLPPISHPRAPPSRKPGIVAKQVILDFDL